MSCERNSNSVSARAGTVSGITAAANKAGFSYGAVLNNVDRMMRSGMNTGLKTMYAFGEAKAKGEAVGAYMLNIAGPQEPQSGIKQAAKGVVKGTVGITAKLALLMA